MSGEIKIDLLEGETILDAIQRLAGVTVAERDERIEAQKPKAKPITVSDPMAGDTVRPDVYSAVHIYQQPSMSDGQIRAMAQRERKSHGPASLVFCHMHAYGEPCSSACKEKVSD